MEKRRCAIAFTAGHSQGSTFSLDGAGPAVVLNITGHNFSEEVNDLITTHSGSGGIQARIAGILEVRGTVEANVDAAALPGAASPGIRAGAKGTITFAVGSAQPTSAHVMITRVNYRSVVNGLVSYSFDVGVDSTSGVPYTRPAAVMEEPSG